MTRALRIAVVGNGIAGAAAAIHLHHRSHRIDQFERSGTDSRAGAGLLLHPAALPALKDLGILDTVQALGAPVRSLVGETLAGRRVMDFQYANGAAKSCAVGIQRQALIDLLQAANPGRDAIITSGAVQSVDAMRGYITLDDGKTHGPYDLVVAADGANSAVRRSVSRIIANDRAYQSAAIVALVHDPARWCGDAVRQYFDGPRHVSVWPVGITASDARPLANVSINVPSAQAGRWLQNGEWQLALGRLCAPLQAMVARDRSSVTPIVYRYRDVRLKRYAIGRVVLIGDAAHSMSPQLGQGALLALQDAATLARLLDQLEDPLQAINRFDAHRRAQIRPIQSLSRWVTPLFQSGSRLLAGIRDLTAARVSGLPAVQLRLQSLFTTVRD